MHRALKNFIDDHGNRVKVGDKIGTHDSKNVKYRYNKAVINDFVERGLIYSSKEEKRVYERTTKANKEHTGAGWYLVKKGNQVIDKVRGKEEAQELVDEINGN